MPKQSLDTIQINAGNYEIGGKGVAQIVETDVFYSRSAQGCLKGGFDCAKGFAVGFRKNIFRTKANGSLIQVFLECF